MSAWMVYATLVGLLVCAGAWIIERAANAHRVPVRGIWTAALVISSAIPAAAWLTRAPVQETPAVAGDLFQRSDVMLVSSVPVEPSTQASSLAVLAERLRYLLTTPPSVPRDWDPIAATLWVLLSLSVGVMLAWSFANLRRAKRRWATASLDGREVLVSDEVGPAVVGVLRPSIVLPRWALALPDQDRELVLRHEEEHRRAGDPHLIFASFLLLALVPWNAALWWQVRRLRMAVELDCDRRVLGRGKHLRRYASLLVEMGRRGAISRLSALALAHPTPLLERRIRTMTTRKKPHYTLTLAAALVASLCAIAAYQVEAPATLAEVLISYADATGAPLVTSDNALPQTPDGAASGMPAAPSTLPQIQLDLPEPPNQVAGRITGRVTDRQTQAPLRFVQVYLVGANQGTLTQENGAFVILNVLPGTYRIRAERIGLSLGSQDITVGEGASVEVRFELNAQAIGVDGVASDGSVIARPEPDPANPPQSAPPTPPVRTPEQLREMPTFTPHTVRPALLNTNDVTAALANEYPASLRGAGIGGTAVVWLFIGPSGVVENTKVQKGSGYPAMDEAALRVASVMRFSPAYNRDQQVAVWVSIPISFKP